MEKLTRNFLSVGVSLIVAYGVMKAIAKMRMENESLDDDNPYIHRHFNSQDSQDLLLLNSKYSMSEEVGLDEEDSGVDNVSIYEKIIKPILDQILSFGGLVLLSPLYGAIALAIKIDDPGPIFFIQKRIGKESSYFYCHKFRSMKMSAPHDVPTHRLENPDQYITKVGRILRKTSLDELPQIWDIFREKMSVIGPRPALWNQSDLVEARSHCVGYDGRIVDANSVMPGLTGLAQIKGRDELEILDKARLDGEYVKILRKGGILALLMDIKCFFGTVKSVLHHDGIVEGGTGTLYTSPINPDDRDDSF